MWQEGNDQLFREKQIDKAMIEKYLNEKTLKGTKSIKFTIIFYWFIQVANLILLSMNLVGYMSNPTMIWILVPQLVITIGIMIFGMDLYYNLREINNYSESLLNLINLQVRFFKRPYEAWLVLTSVSAIILMTNLNLYIDNDNGTYLINNKAMFVGVTAGAFIFIYGVQKLTALLSLRSLKTYLSDLQRGVLDQTARMERLKKRFLWFYVAIFILLCTTLIFGLLAALK
jgi:hypothetical protein